MAQQITPLPRPTLRRPHQRDRGATLGGRLHRPPLHPVPRRPLRRAVIGTADAAPLRLRDQRHRLLPVRPHRRAPRSSRRPTASSSTPPAGTTRNVSASSTRSSPPTASTPRFSKTSRPRRPPRRRAVRGKAPRRTSRRCGRSRPASIGQQFPGLEAEDDSAHIEGVMDVDIRSQHTVRPGLEHASASAPGKHRLQPRKCRRTTLRTRRASDAHRHSGRHRDSA